MFAEVISAISRIRMRLSVPCSIFCIALCIAPPANSYGQYPIPPPITDTTTIEMIITGGGFYGGINPVTLNERRLSSDGTFSVTIKRQYSPDHVMIQHVGRDTVDSLASFLVRRYFFEMQEQFKCGKEDTFCTDQLKKYPKPVPLEVSARIGHAYKKITIQLYDTRLIFLPPALEKFIRRMFALADRVTLPYRRGPG